MSVPEKEPEVGRGGEERRRRGRFPKAQSLQGPRRRGRFPKAQYLQGPVEGHSGLYGQYHRGRGTGTVPASPPGSTREGTFGLSGVSSVTRILMTVEFGSRTETLCVCTTREWTEPLVATVSSASGERRGSCRSRWPTSSPVTTPVSPDLYRRSDLLPSLSGPVHLDVRLHRSSPHPRFRGCVKCMYSCRDGMGILSVTETFRLIESHFGLKEKVVFRIFCFPWTR